MPIERQPGCICQLDEKTGEPVVLGYALCAIHCPDIPKRLSPLEMAKSLSVAYLEITDRIFFVVNNSNTTTDPLGDAVRRIDRANECAVLCVDKIISSHTDASEIDYWSQVRACFKDQVGS